MRSFAWTDNAIRAYTNVLAAGMKPVVELSFTPNPLASGTSTAFHYAGQNSPPKDMAVYRQYIQVRPTTWACCLLSDRACRRLIRGGPACAPNVRLAAMRDCDRRGMPAVCADHDAPVCLFSAVLGAFPSSGLCASHGRLLW